MSKLRGRFTSQILMAFSENLNFTQYIFPYLRESKNTVPTYNCLLFKIEFKTTGTHFLSKTSMTNDLSFQIKVIRTCISRLINGHNQDAATTTTHLHAYPLHTCILKTLHAYFVECGKHKKEWQNKWWSSVIYKWTSFRCSHGLNKLSWTVSTQSFKSRKSLLRQKLLFLKTVTYSVLVIEKVQTA